MVAPSLRSLPHAGARDPFVLNFAPTGAVVSRHESPHVPLSVDAVVAEVAAVARIGITMVHLHVRDDAGKSSLDPERYRALIRGIRSVHADLVICVSCSGRCATDPAERLAPLFLGGAEQPDMASLTLGSMNFSRDASLNSPETVQTLAKTMLRRGIVPELEVFDTGMVNVANVMAKRGYIRPPFYFNLILGNLATAQCDALSLGVLLNALPPRSLWSVGGLGERQIRANTLSLALGGGVRVGIEDNPYFDGHRRCPATNPALVERVHALAGLLERRVMRPDEFRRKMRLRPGRGQYGRDPVMETAAP